MPRKSGSTDRPTINEVKVSAFYRHLKSNNVYFVILIAMLEKDLSELVIYRRCGGTEEENNYIWARPIDEFLKKFNLISQIDL